MDPSDLDPSWTLVHEPRVDEPLVAEPMPDETQVPKSSSQETRVPESSSQETRVPESLSHVTPEASGHADGGEDTLSDDSYKDGELVEGGKKVYQHGGTMLPPVPPTRDQRWLIEPNGEK